MHYSDSATLIEIGFTCVIESKEKEKKEKKRNLQGSHGRNFNFPYPFSQDLSYLLLTFDKIRDCMNIVLTVRNSNYTLIYLFFVFWVASQNRTHLPRLASSKYTITKYSHNTLRIELKQISNVVNCIQSNSERFERFKH